MNNNGITAPRGFLASGVACGLKNNKGKDLAMVVSENLAVAAGIFTTNVVKGHSLLWTKNKIKNGHARAIVINSGCANACLGARGDKDAQDMALYASSLIGCEPDNVIGSTGVISSLDVDKLKGIKSALILCPAKAAPVQQAIMTTDTFPKKRKNEIDDKAVLYGMCKGSGMIVPI